MSKRREITQDDLDELDEIMAKRTTVTPGEAKHEENIVCAPAVRIDQDPVYTGAVDNFITDTPRNFELFKDASRMEFRRHFASEEEFELFCMLPIAPRSRIDFLSRVRELSSDSNKSVVVHTT